MLLTASKREGSQTLAYSNCVILTSCEVWKNSEIKKMFQMKYGCTAHKLSVLKLTKIHSHRKLKLIFLWVEYLEKLSCLHS